MVDEKIAKRVKKAIDAKKKKKTTYPSYKIFNYRFKTDGLNAWFEDENGERVTGYHQFGYVNGLSPFLLADLETYHFMSHGKDTKDLNVIKHYDFERFVQDIKRLHREMLNDIRQTLKSFEGNRNVSDEGNSGGDEE